MGSGSPSSVCEDIQWEDDGIDEETEDSTVDTATPLKDLTNAEEHTLPVSPTYKFYIQ